MILYFFTYFYFFQLKGMRKREIFLAQKVYTVEAGVEPAPTAIFLNISKEFFVTDILNKLLNNFSILLKKIRILIIFCIILQL